MGRMGVAAHPASRIRTVRPGARRSARPAPPAMQPWRDPMARGNEKRVQVTLECTECKRRNYITKKNKVNDRERIELEKYCKWDRKHTTHKETR